MQNNDNITGILARSERGFITWDDIERATEEYKVKLPNTELLYVKSLTFEGLIEYIYRTVIEPIKPLSQNYDYKFYDSVFDNIYVPLCNLYGFQLNIILFCLLVGIDNNYINNIARGRYSSGDPIHNREAVSLVQKWRTRCEAGLFSSVGNHNSIGPMFLLKSVYGYQEQQTLRIESDSNAPRISTKQLQTLTQNEQRPEELENDVLELPPDDNI